LGTLYARRLALVKVQIRDMDGGPWDKRRRWGGRGIGGGGERR
jgi:hypothetical protein